MISKPITNPNYGFAQSIAYQTVRNSNQKKLPLSIKKLIKSIPNLHLQKYSSFAKSHNLTMDETYELLDSEEGCLWMRSDGQYIILYNDTVGSTGRIRFTLAHELGHYILKHNEKSKKTSLSRYSLSNDEYEIFEKEANYFAKRLLAPIPLVDIYISNWKKIYPECIEFAFDTSFTVANYIINDLHRRQRNANIVREAHPLTDNFVDYINQDSCSQICSSCHTIQDLSNRYCVSCGATRFIQSSPENYTTFYLERNNNVIYSRIETDENMTPLRCPRCNSEQLDSQFCFCPYCGTYIHNVCLGREEDKYIELITGEVELSIKERHDRNSCSSNILDGGFRFCPDCGNETSFYAQGLLANWKEEQKQNSDPFSEKKLTKLPFD